MSLKRGHTDPDYDDAEEYQSKRLCLVKEEARESTCQKIMEILQSEFTKEIDYKEKELLVVNERLIEARIIMDKLRACIVANFYRSSKESKFNNTNTHPALVELFSKSCSSVMSHDTSSSVTSHDASSSVTSKNTSNSVTSHNTSSCLTSQNTSSSGTNQDVSSSITSQDTINCVTTHDTRTCATSHNFSNSVLTHNSSDKVTSLSSDYQMKKYEDLSNEIPNLSKSIRNEISQDRRQLSMKHKIIVGNISKYLIKNHREQCDPSTHKWMLYVRGPRDSPDITHIVHKVVVFLHQSYQPNDIVEMCAAPFHVTRRGWGEFPIRVQLHLKGHRKRTLDIIHHLKLDKTYTGLQTFGAETIIETEINSNDTFTPRPSQLLAEDDLLNKDIDHVTIDHNASEETGSFQSSSVDKDTYSNYRVKKELPDNFRDSNHTNLHAFVDIKDSTRYRSSLVPQITMATGSQTFSSCLSSSNIVNSLSSSISNHSYSKLYIDRKNRTTSFVSTKSDNLRVLFVNTNCKSSSESTTVSSINLGCKPSTICSSNKLKSLVNHSKGYNNIYHGSKTVVAPIVSVDRSHHSRGVSLIDPDKIRSMLAWRSDSSGTAANTKYTKTSSSGLVNGLCNNIITSSTNKAGNVAPKFSLSQSPEQIPTCVTNSGSSEVSYKVHPSSEVPIARVVQRISKVYPCRTINYSDETSLTNYHQICTKPEQGRRTLSKIHRDNVSNLTESATVFGHINKNILSDTKSILGIKKRSQKPLPDLADPYINIENYSSTREILAAVIKFYPVVQGNADRSVYPYCAKSVSDWLSWGLGKRRASEWMRARDLRRLLKRILSHDQRTSSDSMSLWSTKEIMLWCRTYAHSPTYLECNDVDDESEDNPREVRDISYTDVSLLLQHVGQEDINTPWKMLTTHESDLYIDVENNDQPARVRRVNPISCLTTILPSEEALTIQDILHPVGLKCDPVLFEDFRAPLVEEMLYSILLKFMEDLLRESFAHVYTNYRCRRRISKRDVFSGIKSLKFADFLTNCYLGRETTISAINSSTQS